MNLEAVNRLVGIPWKYAENDCWQVFRRASADVFGVDVPNVAGPPEYDENVTSVLFKEHAQGGQWRRSVAPLPGCAVLFWSPVHPVPVHIGIYLPGGDVLHCMQGHNTRIDALRVLQRIFKQIEYYEYQQDHSI